MVLATEAASQLNILATLPPNTSSAQHPLSLARPQVLQFPHPQPLQPLRNPDAMEVDALGMCPSNSLMDQTCSICHSRKLCFQCLKPIVLPLHTGSINCLHEPVLLDQLQAFLDRIRQNPTTQVSALLTEQPAVPLDHPLTFCPSDQPVDHEVVLPLPPSFPSPFDAANLHSHDKFYEDLEEGKVAIVPVLTVHVRLNVSKGGRILVPKMFKLAGGVMILATIPVNTRSMANFINKGLV
ncbi:hypothetical protein PCANC_20360 [Puccinia coronata f. sp. avenae]|uniref:Uncharacterized protein n=1 Tax=Puccinia coronata f. sp. avenae TaxID=200324 RepID=A0A2N5U1M7_9BASI|nr:hypothetical protein PCANC_20360 [Puccinia coronata f. sp. avenae]